uniref:Major facilitator superfamily (MFS) profile domain-containing protein n=1 Tax=Ciona intestinalis TaxID=7719 RepID=F6YLB5_CIOIN
TMSYEDILKAVGGFGRYQKLLTLLLVVSGIPNGYLVLTIVFVGMTPPHRCCVPGIEECSQTWEAHIPHHDIDGVKYSQCGMISTDSNTTKQCTNGWVFDIDSDRTTFVTEWELVCDRSLYRPLLTALFMAGVMCGSTLSGFLSDRFGRRPVFLAGTFGMFVCFGLCGISTSPIMYAITLFLSGAMNLVNYATAYVLASEVISTSKRVITGTLTIAAFAIGYMLIPLLAYFLPHWRTLYLITSLTGFLFIPYIWLIDESPSWLLSKGKFEEFWKLVRKIAKSNGVPEENSTSLNELKLITQKEENKETAESWSDLFRHFKHRRVFATLLNKCFTWFSCSVAYYVLSLNTSNFGGSPYINCFLAAAVEIPAYAIVILALKKIGRKSFVFGSLFFGLNGLIAHLFIVSTKGAIASAMIGKLCVAACFSVIYLYCAELFPTPIRTTAVGLCSMSARVGAIVAPYLLYAGETYSSLPYLIIFGLSFLSAFFILWLPETCLATLPESKNDMLRLKLNLKEIFKIHKIIGKGSENNNDANEDQKSVTEPLSV